MLVTAFSVLGGSWWTLGVLSARRGDKEDGTLELRAADGCGVLQPQHYRYLGLDNPLSWGTVQCVTAGVPNPWDLMLDDRRWS